MNAAKNRWVSKNRWNRGGSWAGTFYKW